MTNSATSGDISADSIDSGSWAPVSENSSLPPSDDSEDSKERARDQGGWSHLDGNSTPVIYSTEL